MKNIIQFFIGDWSDDGHGKGESFIVLSNTPVQELREIYFRACKNLGVRLDGDEVLTTFPPPCSNYGDGEFPSVLLEHLKSKGVVINEPEDPDLFEPKDFLEIVFAVIKWENPRVVFGLLEPETFHFYGVDKKERHIGYFGYGLFH